MRKIELTAFELAERFVGIKEVSGSASNPAILAMLKLDDPWPTDDVVPWCSAFVNYICWLLRLPRSKSLTARSWLSVGRSIEPEEAHPRFDIVILMRGGGNQPGPSVLNAPGHVGFFAGYGIDGVHLLAGNQGDSVNVSVFHSDQILGVRRIFE